VNIEVALRQDNKVWPNYNIGNNKFDHTVMLLRTNLYVQQTGIGLLNNYG
jgi:hypothetical protein